MPVPAAVPHVDGTVMDWSDVDANLAAYRGWINGIPPTDYGAESIQREHLAAPVIQGFPSNSIDSTFQSLAWRDFGHEEDAISNQQWGARLGRLVLLPALLAEEDRWTFPIGASFYLPELSWVQVRVGFECHVRHPQPAVDYPDGVGGGNRGGHVVLQTRQRSSGSIIEWGQSVRHLYPSDSLADGGIDMPVRTGFSAQLTTGYWDVSLVYFRSTGAVDIYQYDLSRVTMKIEIH